MDPAEDVQQLIADIVELYNEAHYSIHHVRGRDGRTTTPIIVLKEDLISRNGRLDLKVRQLLARIIRVPDGSMTELILDPPRASAAFIGFVAKVFESLILSADGVPSVTYPSLLVVMESRGRFKPGHSPNHPSRDAASWQRVTSRGGTGPTRTKASQKNSSEDRRLKATRGGCRAPHPDYLD